MPKIFFILKQIATPFSLKNKVVSCHLENAYILQAVSFIQHFCAAHTPGQDALGIPLMF